MDIKTERLWITKLTPDMAAAMQINSLDEDNRRFVPDEVFETVEEAKAVIDGLIRAYGSEKGPFVYALLLNAKTNIGYVQACKIREGWEIGYHIAARYAGQGYATEAVNAFIPVILKQLETDRLYGIVLEENKVSHKVLEKCRFGLRFQGVDNYQGKPENIRRYIWMQ